MTLDPHALGLAPHPEGGWFRETWRSPVTVTTPHGPRAAATSITYLLGEGEWSAWHRVRHDELWLWQGGGVLRLTLGGDGPRPVPGERSDLDVGAQVLVPGGVWQTARPLHEAALIACVVAPGFDPADFELLEDGPGAG